jgi:hypothetical protein
MTDEETWLDLAVLEYIKTNSGKVYSVDVVSHFGLRCDITLFAINRLEEAGRVEKKYLCGNQSRLYFLK